MICCKDKLIENNANFFCQVLPQNSEKKTLRKILQNFLLLHQNTVIENTKYVKKILQYLTNLSNCTESNKYQYFLFRYLQISSM